MMPKYLTEKEITRGPRKGQKVKVEANLNGKIKEVKRCKGAVAKTLKEVERRKKMQGVKQPIKVQYWPGMEPRKGSSPLELSIQASQILKDGGFTKWGGSRKEKPVKSEASIREWLEAPRVKGKREKAKDKKVEDIIKSLMK